jgi:hypothetical protein
MSGSCQVFDVYEYRFPNDYQATQPRRTYDRS